MKNKIKAIAAILVFVAMVVVGIVGTILAAFTDVPQFLWYDLNTLRASCGLSYLRFSCGAMFVIFVIGVFCLITSIIQKYKQER